MDQLRKRKESATQSAIAAGSRQVVYDDLQPSIEWSHGPDSHVLCLDLPGFKRDDLKVQVDNSGKLTVNGKRQVTKTRYHIVEQVFQVPEDANIDEIGGKLEQGHLILVMPKQKVEPEDLVPPPPPFIDRNDDNREKESSETKDEKCNKEWPPANAIEELEGGILEGGLMERFMDRVYENRKVIAVAVMAFSVGFYVSRKLRSSG